MWRIWRAPNNASKGQIGFNSAFKGLNVFSSVKIPPLPHVLLAHADHTSKTTEYFISILGEITPFDINPTS